MDHNFVHRYYLPSEPNNRDKYPWSKTEPKELLTPVLHDDVPSLQKVLDKSKIDDTIRSFNESSPNSTSKSLLHYCLQFGSIKCLKFLLSLGANRESLEEIITDDNNNSISFECTRTPLHHLVKTNHFPLLFEPLMNFGSTPPADINGLSTYSVWGQFYSDSFTTDQTTETALFAAVQSNKPHLVRLLVQAGADHFIHRINKRVYPLHSLDNIFECCNKQWDLLEALEFKFNGHKHFHQVPAQIQKAIKTFLICNEHSQWGLVRDVRDKIFSALVVYWMGKV